MKQYSGKKNFPDPLAPQQEKETKDYGLKYAKAIESQWGKRTDSSSLFSKRYTLFKRNKEYAKAKMNNFWEFRKVKKKIIQCGRN